jgi:hypothetical protein
MTTFHSHVIQTTLSIMVFVLCAYASGRAHQWYRHSLDRDQAFRDGYNQASRGLFHIAARMRRRAEPEVGEVTVDHSLRRVSGRLQGVQHGEEAA